MSKFFMSASMRNTDLLICAEVLMHTLYGKTLGKLNTEIGAIEIDDDNALTPDDLRDLADFIEEYL